MLRHSIESIVKNDDSANNKSPSSTSSSPRPDDCSPPPPSTASSGGYSGGPDYITSNFQNVFQSHILSAVSHPHTSRLSGADNSMQWFAQLCQREFEQFNQSIIQSGAGGYIANGVDQPTGLFVQPYRKPKRIRTAFNPHQLAQLELAFDSNHYVIGGERKVLAKRLDLSETQVKVWFQNRRTKAKRVKTETSSTVAADK